ncbi:MAG: hypothetical protein HFE57_05300 [Firmicutes bacterium]|nr:hypothetical protein [Bacillota bacterium]
MLSFIVILLFHSLHYLLNTLNNVLITYKKSSGEFPKRIVIHRDGFSNEEKNWYIEYFNRRNIEFDIVEIRKNISVRLLEENEISNGMNLKSGSTVIKDNMVYIITTNVKRYLGAPRPLLLVHRHGNLSMEVIARQVYILSEMHIGSMRTSRLPLTTLHYMQIRYVSTMTMFLIIFLQINYIFYKYL